MKLPHTRILTADTAKELEILINEWADKGWIQSQLVRVEKGKWFTTVDEVIMPENDDDDDDDEDDE